jgi:urease accessory protein
MALVVARPDEENASKASVTGSLSSPALGAAALLRLLQLASPALPVGAFAFSQGLESAVALGFIDDEKSSHAWLSGTLSEGLGRLDLPILARLHRALGSGDEVALLRWSRYLVASRESRERRLEDEQLGRALARLLADQGVTAPDLFGGDENPPFASYFALGSVAFGIPLAETLLGFAFSWAENQVGALSRLVPLGQLAAQRVLAAIGTIIPETVSVALELPDAELGACLPRLALASALHETQYTRLFVS